MSHALCSMINIYVSYNMTDSTFGSFNFNDCLLLSLLLLFYVNNEFNSL